MSNGVLNLLRKKAFSDGMTDGKTGERTKRLLYQGAYKLKATGRYGVIVFFFQTQRCSGRRLRD